MSFELKMILIYTLIFAIIGVFIWAFISYKNKKDKKDIDREYDLSTDNDQDDDLTLSDYENMDTYIPISRSSNSTEFDSIDDFLNNFSFREDDYDVIKEEDNINDNMDYTISIDPIKSASKNNEVINVLIGKKAYIFLANGNKLENGTKIVLRIDDKDYDGVVVKANYEKDLSTLNTLPKNLEVVKIINE